MRTWMQVAALGAAGIAAGWAGNRFTPHPAPLGSRVLPSAEQPGAVCEDPHASIARISVDQAKPMCVACTATFIDARSPDEYAAGHVTGALHLAPGESIDPLLQTLLKAPMVIVYDRDRECSAANQVAAQIRARGVREVRVLTGAWPEWLAQGGPGESGSCGLCTPGTQ